MPRKEVEMEVVEKVREVRYRGKEHRYLSGARMEASSYPLSD